MYHILLIYYFRTLLKQEAVIKVQGIPLTSYLEDLVVTTCNTNAQKVSTRITNAFSSVHN